MKDMKIIYAPSAGSVIREESVKLYCRVKGSACTNHHFNDHGKAILVEIHGGEVGRKFFREHWEYLGSSINRGGIMLRVFVNR
jgi:hypothetical protein